MKLIYGNIHYRRKMDDRNYIKVLAKARRIFPYAIVDKPKSQRTTTSRNRIFNNQLKMSIRSLRSQRLIKLFIEFFFFLKKYSTPKIKLD